MSLLHSANEIFVLLLLAPARAPCDGSLTTVWPAADNQQACRHRPRADGASSRRSTAVPNFGVLQNVCHYRALLQRLPALHPCGAYCSTLTTASSNICVAGDETAPAPNCTINEVRISPCAEASEGKPCVIKRGRSASIEFDFTTSKCPIAVRVG